MGCRGTKFPNTPDFLGRGIREFNTSFWVPCFSVRLPFISPFWTIKIF